MDDQDTAYSLVLMENAGRRRVAAVESLYPDLAERRVAIVCGKGSNSGDGFVARTLIQRASTPRLLIAREIRATPASTSRSPTDRACSKRG